MQITPDFKFKPYPYQLFPFQQFEQGIRRIILVWPRRAGKDLTAVQFTLIQALRRVGTYFYFLPTHKQAKRIIWDGMDDEGNKFLSYIPDVLIEDKNESELQITLVNGSIIQLIGADTIDTSALGTNCVGAIFSEYSVQNPSGWDYVRPILRRNKGWALFLYTPRGHNWGYDLYTTNKDNPDWAVSKLTAKDLLGHNGEELLPRAYIDAEIRSGMATEKAEQEFNTSFSGIQQGCFFAEACTKVEAEGRYGLFPYNPSYKVYTVSDLGKGNNFVTWFFQILPGTVNWFDYEPLESGAIPEFIKMVRSKPYIYAAHYAPFDVNITDIGTGKSRIDAARKLGLFFRALPKPKFVADRIDTALRVFPVSTFNAGPLSKAYGGWSALLNYRRIYDEAKREYSNEEEHDWASHGGSAFCYGAMAVEKLDKHKFKEETAETDFDEFQDLPKKAEMDFDEVEDDAWGD